MRKVIICKGLPASGKSKWAKEQVAKSNCNIKRVNKDDLRSMLDSGKYSKGNESFILRLRDNIILNSLAEGKSVIVDDTNFFPKHEEQIREIVSDYNEGLYGNDPTMENKVQVEIKFFDVSPEECIIRDLKRPNLVGAKIIWDMYNKYLKPKIEEIEPMKQNPDLPHAVIIDLDGTLCIHNGRSPFEYDKCDTDLVNRPVRKILSSIMYEWNVGGIKTNIIFLSGREDSCKEKTIKWLKETAGIDINFDLYMRKTGDSRKDCIVKREIFDAEIKDKYYVEFILDDRNQVVNMWRSMGLTCLQVADGDF